MRNFFLRIFPGTLNIFVLGDSAFMLFKCMCNNISIETKNFLEKRICPYLTNLQNFLKCLPVFILPIGLI